MKKLEIETIRLQKALAQAGVASRREAELWIAAGRVSVNGTMVTEMGHKVSASDKIAVDCKPVLGQEPLVYILLYKPTGCVTTTDDPYDRKTVMDFVKDIKLRMYPVGRLDYETEGALILTNDGDLANKLMHPRFGVYKTYHAVVSGKVTEATLNQLASGIELDNTITAPAEVKLLGTDGLTSKIEIRLHEGRNRQVRRMLDEVQHAVLSLTRVAYGTLTLSGLRPGAWRHLTENEVVRLREQRSTPANARKRTQARRR